jgi:hypothetical protein
MINDVAEESDVFLFIEELWQPSQWRHIPFQKSVIVIVIFNPKIINHHSHAREVPGETHDTTIKTKNDLKPRDLLNFIYISHLFHALHKFLKIAVPNIYFLRKFIVYDLLTEPRVQFLSD